ncbi:hypothetical protein D9601_07270 [Sphingomonas sp. MA1305]|nr:hypothetical protein [Sphingomonas sp. MA1305]
MIALTRRRCRTRNGFSANGTLFGLRRVRRQFVPQRCDPRPRLVAAYIDAGNQRDMAVVFTGVSCPQHLFPQCGDAVRTQHLADGANGLRIPPADRLEGIFEPRQNDRSDAVQAFDLRDRQAAVRLAPGADRSGQQHGEAILLDVLLGPVLQIDRPVGDVEIGRVDVEQQRLGRDVERRCDAAQLGGLGDDLAPFDLRQSDIGDVGQSRRQAEQGRDAALPPDIADPIGKDDRSITVDLSRCGRLLRRCGPVRLWHRRGQPPSSRARPVARAILATQAWHRDAIHDRSGSFPQDKQFRSDKHLGLRLAPPSRRPFVMAR